MCCSVLHARAIQSQQARYSNFHGIFCSVLQCVAVWYSVLHCLVTCAVAHQCSKKKWNHLMLWTPNLQLVYIAYNQIVSDWSMCVLNSGVWWGALLCVAVCCSVLQRNSNEFWANSGGARAEGTKRSFENPRAWCVFHNLSICACIFSNFSLSVSLSHAHCFRRPLSLAFSLSFSRHSFAAVLKPGERFLYL